MELFKIVEYDKIKQNMLRVNDGMKPMTGRIFEFTTMDNEYYVDVECGYTWHRDMLIKVNKDGQLLLEF